MVEPLPAIFDGFYEMVGELGRGATGTVYEARHKTLKRRVALKVPGFSSDAEQLVKAQRFLCECRALAHLTSVPGCNIPRLLVVTEYPEGRPYCVRELVEGSTLEQRIADGSIGLRAGLAVVAETVRVVEWVHAQGFAHRNLSPSNVLVDRDGSVWLMGSAGSVCWPAPHWRLPEKERPQRWMPRGFGIWYGGFVGRCYSLFQPNWTPPLPAQSDPWAPLARR